MNRPSPTTHEAELRRWTVELTALHAIAVELVAPHDLPTLLWTIVERHGGHIAVGSQPRAGGLFRIRLPWLDSHVDL